MVPNTTGTTAIASAAFAPALAAAAAAHRPFHMLVLLVDFSDKPASVAASSFDSLLFQDTIGPASVRGYYNEVSAGGVDLQPVSADLPSAIGWLRMPHTYSYYVGNAQGTGSYPGNSQGLLEDAAAAAYAKGVDFSQYDNDGDGVVDGIILVHAGTGAEFTNSKKDIWSHEWYAHSPAPTYDGVQLGPYSTEPEYWVSPGDMTVGVYCHEIGHIFGLPDLYDTTNNSEGLGSWSLMAAGSWNGPGGMGGSPARFDAWSLEKLGFDTLSPVTAISSSEPIVAASSTAEGTILRVEKGGATAGAEYYLVENRRKAGTDAYLPGAGLLIYHVDETQTSNDDASHYMVGIEEAHGGTQDLQTGANRGDAGDPFPGTSNNRSFTDTSDPSAAYFTGPSNIRIEAISSSATTMTALVTPDATKVVADTTPPVTTSNALSSYDGTATISLSPTDARARGSRAPTGCWTARPVPGRPSWSRATARTRSRSGRLTWPVTPRRPRQSASSFTTSTRPRSRATRLRRTPSSQP